MVVGRITRSSRIDGCRRIVKEVMRVLDATSVTTPSNAACFTKMHVRVVRRCCSTAHHSVRPTSIHGVLCCSRGSCSIHAVVALEQRIFSTEYLCYFVFTFGRHVDVQSYISQDWHSRMKRIKKIKLQTEFSKNFVDDRRFNKYNENITTRQTEKTSVFVQFCSSNNI